MAKNPLVSVCLPLCNGEKYIADAIISVVQQTYRNFELVIADDGSKDLGAAIVQGFCKQDKRIRYFKNERKLGLFENYNEAMRNSLGVYIKPFAQDDLLEPKALESLVTLLEQKPAVALVSCTTQWVDEKGNALSLSNETERKQAQPFQTDKRLGGPEVSQQTLRDALNWLGEPCAVMFRKSYVGTGFDARFTQLGDIEYWYRILQHGDFYFLSETLCSLRKHPEQATKKNRKNLKSMLDWMLIASKHRHLLTGAEGEDEYCTRFANGFVEAVRSRLFAQEEVGADDKFAALMDYTSLLRSFEADQNKARDTASEYQAFAALCLREAARREQELHIFTQVAGKQQVLIEALEHQLAQQESSSTSEIAQLQAMLDEVGNSLSWKVTAPLREVKKLLN